MNKTNLIHQFFDGGIEGAEEEALFAALAADRELRREFVEHLKIASFIQHDTTMTGPPAEVSNAVFAALGLPQPGAPFDQRDDESAWQKLGVLIQRILPFLLTVVVTSAVTTGILMLSEKSQIDFGTAPPAGPSLQMNEQSPAHSAPAQTDATRGHIPAAGNESVRAGNTVPDMTDAGSGHAFSGVTGKRDRSDVSETRTADESFARNIRSVPGVPAPGETETALAPDAAVQMPENNPAAAGTGQWLDGNVETAPVALYPVRESDPEEAAGNYRLYGMPSGQTPFTIANMVFQLRLVGLHTAIPDVGLQAPTEGVFRLMTFSGLYKVSERHAFGVTYGREPFGRIYTRMVPDKNRVETGSLGTPPEKYIAKEFRDFDMLDWGGVTWKMSHTKLGMFHTFYPFTEITAAVSKYGPVGRAMAGIELYPSDMSMINIGVELSSLTYKIENKMYTSNKIGGSFGVAIGF